MKALVLVGKDQELAFQDVEMPVLTEGSILVKLKAAALNHRDVWIQKGQYAGIKYPSIPTAKKIEQALHKLAHSMLSMQVAQLPTSRVQAA